MFSLQYYEELMKNPQIKIFFTDPKLKEFINSLNPQELVKLFKRYSQLEIGHGPERFQLFTTASKYFNQMSADDLYSIVVYSSELPLEDSEKELWFKLLKAIEKYLDSYFKAHTFYTF